MRFRYFDASGEEVRVSSVDALKFRIDTGAVTTETLLYDAAVDQWAPAEEHAVFRFLAEEDGAGEGDAGQDRREEGPNPDSASQTTGLPPTAELERPVDSASGAPSGRTQEGASPSPRLRPGEGHVVLSLDEGGVAKGQAAEAEAVAPEPNESTVESRVDSGESYRPSDARSADRVQLPPPGPAVLPHRPDPGGAFGEEPPRPRVAARRFGAAALLLAAAVAAVLLVRGGGGDDGAAFAVAGELNSLLSSEPAAASAESAGIIDASPVSGAAAPEGRTPTSISTPAPDAPSESRMEELAAEVAAAATGDLGLALMDLKLALNVPDRPPEIWLHGRYLAAADSFPGVRGYWQSVAAYVTAMQELDEDLYRGFVESRVLRMRLDTTSAADLSALALEQYQRTADQRSETFRNLTELTGLALQLHDVLASHSEEIAYEPFDSRSLSRDPVVEAVADDPELAQEIWRNLDGIFTRLEELQGLGPVSTALLQDAVLEELKGEGGGG